VPLPKLMVSSPWYLGIAAKINLENMLLRGFTTVRDMGGADGSIAQAVNEGLVAGPRVFPSGMGLSQTGGHFDIRLPYQPHPDLDGIPYFRDSTRMFIVVDGVDAVLRAARENLRRGATQIKIAGSGGVTSEDDPLESTQFTPEEVRAAVAAAQAWGTYVVAHAYTAASVRMLIENGVKQVAHGHLLDEATIRLAAERGVAIETENVWIWVDEHLAKETGITPASLKKLAEVKKELPHYFSLLKKHKIRIGFGTDILGPGAQFQSKEFTLRAQYFTPFEVLKQATSENYEIINMSGPLNRYGKFGVIEEGALADILLVNGNPLDNIALLEEPEKNLALIMKEGKIYKNQVH